LWKTPPLPPDPHHPGRQSDGVWKAAALTLSPGTLPHPLENATRFPQPVGHDGGEERGVIDLGKGRSTAGNIPQ
jgi:hypothetical protein